MRILITGAKGFVGKNLTEELQNHPDHELFEYDLGSDPSLLDYYCKESDFVFHLAGVNRPKQLSEFMDGNLGFTSTLTDLLKENNNSCPVMLASSVQAALDNPYGQSKKASEDQIFAYGAETGAQVLVYRFPNIFGKWGKPDFNSAVITFCHNIARDQPIEVHDPERVMNLVYIDDVVQELVRALDGRQNKKGTYCEVSTVYSVRLGEIEDLIQSFEQGRKSLLVPDMRDPFTKKLYSTYLSYLPPAKFGLPLTTHEDLRGSFTELIRMPDGGQMSVNISKPGVIKGNHWHQSKVEKFLVVSGSGVIRLRQVGGEEVLEYFVSGHKLERVDIPPGYTHNIENVGDSDLITLIWVNEAFDPDNPDTYFLEV